MPAGGPRASGKLCFPQTWRDTFIFLDYRGRHLKKKKTFLLQMPSKTGSELQRASPSRISPVSAAHLLGDLREEGRREGGNLVARRAAGPCPWLGLPAAPGFGGTLRRTNLPPQQPGSPSSVRAGVTRRKSPSAGGDAGPELGSDTSSALPAAVKNRGIPFRKEEFDPSLTCHSHKKVKK